MTDCRYITEPAAIAGTAAVPRSEARLSARRLVRLRSHVPRGIGKVPLLTAPQEVDLAMRIEGGEMGAALIAVTPPDGRLDLAGFLLILEFVDRIRAHSSTP